MIKKKKKSSPVPSPIIAILCFGALQYAYPNQQKLLLVIKGQVSRQTTSCFDTLPALCCQDILVTSNQVHWKNKWRSGERNWLVANLLEFMLIHPVCSVPISAWLMTLPWNIFVQESRQRHFLVGKQAENEAGGLERREAYLGNTQSFSSKLTQEALYF